MIQPARALALALGACASAAPPAAPPSHVATSTATITAAPERRELRVPIKLALVRTADAIVVRVDRALGAATITTDPSLHQGISYELRVYPDGQASMASASGFASGTELDFGEHRAPAIAGKRYVVELELAVFETDIAPDHMWRPQHGARYKVLWTNTLRETVE